MSAVSMRKAQEKAPARVEAEAGGVASILRLAIASLSSAEFLELMPQPIALSAI